MLDWPWNIFVPIDIFERNEPLFFAFRGSIKKTLLLFPLRESSSLGPIFPKLIHPPRSFFHLFGVVSKDLSEKLGLEMMKKVGSTFSVCVYAPASKRSGVWTWDEIRKVLSLSWCLGPVFSTENVCLHTYFSIGFEHTENETTCWTTTLVLWGTKICEKFYSMRCVQGHSSISNKITSWNRQEVRQIG